MAEKEGRERSQVHERKNGEKGEGDRACWFVGPLKWSPQPGHTTGSSQMLAGEAAAASDIARGKAESEPILPFKGTWCSEQERGYALGCNPSIPGCDPSSYQSALTTWSQISNEKILDSLHA